MEGFKKLPKMQCFKEGGFVTKKEYKREEKAEEVKDTAEDKKIVKKAFSIHDKELHEGEKTDLSTLKKGGRAKKESGTVKKYKTGGSIPGSSIEMKKSSGDLDKIRKVKETTPKVAAAPSKGTVKAKGTGAKTNKLSGDLDPTVGPAAVGPAAQAPSKGSVKPSLNGVDDIDGYCGGKKVK